MKRRKNPAVLIALVFGMAVIGCEQDKPVAETGGSLTVTNTTADVYEYEFSDPRGRTLDWGDLYGYRSVTLRGSENGVHELKYREKTTPASSWRSRYGNLSDGENSKLNIPVQ